MVDHFPSPDVSPAVPPAVWRLFTEPVGICVVLHSGTGTAINGQTNGQSNSG